MADVDEKRVAKKEDRSDRYEERTVNSLHPQKEDLAKVEPGQSGSHSEADRKQPRE